MIVTRRNRPRHVSTAECRIMHAETLRHSMEVYGEHGCLGRFLACFFVYLSWDYFATGGR